MNPIYKQEEARHYCMELISMINSKVFFLKQISTVSEERKNQGIMIGSLVCYNKTDKAILILHAISGISKIISCNEEFIDELKWHQEDDCFVFFKNGVEHKIVPSIVDGKKITEALKKNDKEIHRLTEEINKGNKNLISERTVLTDESLRNVFSLYKFTSWNKQKISLNSIINQHEKLPSTGTGDCCAPKLLSYAFQHNLLLSSMDEVFFGENTKNKINLKSYPPCVERCDYILPSILGLNILYKDSSIIVVNKPSGMLSVPGLGDDKQDCVVSRVKFLFPETIEQPSVHRLDMETSGLLVLALTKESHKELSRQFMEGLVHKKYEALIDGVLEKGDGKSVPKQGEKEGKIELKFRLDIQHRPYQIYDEIYGKLGITLWQKIGIEYYYNPVTGEKRKATRMTYIPLTGRTHQLRLISSDINGFGLPIIGDSLYGKKETGERLMLHAKEINFFHPVSGEEMHFECRPDF